MVFQLTLWQSQWHDGALSKLNVAIEALNRTKEVSSVTPAKPVFDSVRVLLTVIRDSNEPDYVELGLNCADVCQALDRGLNGRQVDKLNESVLQAITQFTTTVATIQNVVKQGKQNVFSRIFHAKRDRSSIATWRQDLTNVLQIFNTELAINTHKLVVDTHRNVLTGQAGAHAPGERQSTQARVPRGELPPPAPRTCFGRDQLIKKLVGFAQHLELIVLIGAGGIGKTSIALTLLHHNRMKDKFGGNRRFIRCDQFPASSAHFLAQLSKVIGAGVENPEDLVPLRPLLSSQEMLIVLDNAESVLDPRGPDAREIYGIVDELCQFRTICLCITSRLTTVPWHCKLLEIPILSMEAARDVFYSIHGNRGQSSIIDDLLRRLDFHALSITLLATTASHNMWDHSELAKEWDMQREKVLRTGHNESLAATIELSLSSPTFRKLGADARCLLEVVAFFLQGVDERNFDLFFPTISDRKDIFGKFRVLSLTHQTNGFITMLTPIRDYLCPQDPKSSLLLCAVKACYFSRLSVGFDRDERGFEEGQWIKSEDVNVEHLLNVFIGTSIDTNAEDIWVACAHFLEHLFWHKPRQTVLGPKIIGLPDDHPYKPKCLFELSKLFQSVGNYAEQKRLLSHVLRLYRQRGNNAGVAATLGWLSETNQMLKLYEKGARQAKEAWKILGRFDDMAGPDLTYFFDSDEELDASEVAAPHALKILPQRGQEFKDCQSHCFLGDRYLSRGDREQAIQHFETALRIASTFTWRSQLFGVHNYLAELFLDQDKFSDAQVHIENAKSHMVGGTYDLGVAMVLQASTWFRQNRLEDARSEALGALEIFGKLGAADSVGACRYFLQMIEQATKPSENPLGEV